MKRFLFSIRMAFLSLCRNRFVTSLAVVAIAGALLVLSIFALVVLNIHYALRGVASQMEVEVFLVDGVSERYARALADSLEQMPDISLVKVVSPEDAREHFVARWGESLIVGLDDNPFPVSLRVRFKDEGRIRTAVAALKKMLLGNPAVDMSFFPSRAIERLRKLRRLFLMLTAGWLIILVIGAIFTTESTIRLGIAARSEMVTVMLLVGADRGFVKLPFVVEGLIQGLLSAGIWLAAFFGVEKITVFLLPWVVSLPLSVIIVIAGLGVILGIMGSLIAINSAIHHTESGSSRL